MTRFLSLDRGWNFRRLPSDKTAAAEAWTKIDLPHSPFVIDLDGHEHWFGECEYQRTIELPPDAPAARCALHLGAAMHSAIVLADGVECGRHSGGYLPFEVDLTAVFRDGRPHVITVRLDNRDNAEVPPGKPYADLDFCWYGGLYRDAELRCYPAVHITDAVEAGVVAGGGIFIRTFAATPASATVNVKTHLRNAAAKPQTVEVLTELLDEDRVIARSRETKITIAAGGDVSTEATIIVPDPRLWQPDSPQLYRARITVRAADETPLDKRSVRFGIRRLAFSRSSGFTINGQRLRLRGTNRHQDHPYVGYALPPAAQRRDARRIKEAGFDYVRLSHYPQSPEFLEACDELGIVVMNCIPGWQFMGGESFRERCRQNARELIRRDRNHPCVVLWELSLNETEMEASFMDALHAIGHEEYPGGQMFTCGWQDRYDVFIHSRQHGQIHRWRNGDKALVIAEYGDWEFYAATEGFDQKTGAGIFDFWSHGRKRREDGEFGLRRQAANHVLALNDTLSSPAVLDGQWSMFDYPRGYDPVRAACGVMDIFRLPKFSYHFYRSQRDAGEGGAGWTGGPVVFIASHWTPISDLRIQVFSNCEEVELRLNGAVVERQRPAKTAFTQYLPHAPFVFHLPNFTPGTLEAIGYVAGRPEAQHRLGTPGAPAKLILVSDDLGIVAADSQPDLLFLHAEIRDAVGNICVAENSAVRFSLEGEATLIGTNAIAAEAGIASILVRVPAGSPGFDLEAVVAAPHLTSEKLRWHRKPAGEKKARAGGALVGAR